MILAGKKRLHDPQQLLMPTEEDEWTPEGQRCRRANQVFSSIRRMVTPAVSLGYSFLSGFRLRSRIVRPVSAMLFIAAVELRKGRQSPSPKTKESKILVAKNTVIQINCR